MDDIALDTGLTISDLSSDILLQEYYSRYLAENSLYEFTKQAWHEIEGDNEYVDNWHIKAICDHLQAAFTRTIRNLMIHIPPRHMKSILTCVMFPAWCWLHDPSERFVYASYALSLSERDSVKCRRLISSPWYRARWGHVFDLMDDNNLKLSFETNKHGHRIATSVNGTNTGKGGTILICDDPNNAKDGESQVMRQTTNDWYSQVWATRLDNPQTGVRIVIQQRLHENDLSGYILSQDTEKKWTNLVLPAEYEIARGCETVVLPNTKDRWKDPRTKEGELLWPARVGRTELDQIKRDLGSAYNISGQLQQLPSPSGGGIFKKDDFKWWKKSAPPKVDFVIASWDTALSTNQFNSAFSACTVWGYFKAEDNVWSVILLNMYKAIVPFTELRQVAKNISEDYRNDGKSEIVPDGRHHCDLVLVEAKANGLSLIQELRAAGINAFRFDPKHDKVERAQIASVYVQSGCVYIPAMPPSFIKLRPMADEFVNLCARFPMDDASKDVVDSFSQMAIHLRNSGYFRHPKDPEPTNKVTKPKHGFYGYQE